MQLKQRGLLKDTIIVWSWEYDFQGRHYGLTVHCKVLGPLLS